jgi:CRP-like cAMP-binding protein
MSDMHSRKDLIQRLKRESKVPLWRAHCAPVTLGDIFEFLDIKELIPDKDQETPCYYRDVQEDSPIFEYGDEFDHIYIVAFGAISVSAHEEDTNRVTDILLCGELLGGECIPYLFHTNSAYALTKSLILCIPCSYLVHLCNNFLFFESYLVRKLASRLEYNCIAEELRKERKIEARVAFFILWVSLNIVQHAPALEIDLNLIRKEIASYLQINRDELQATLDKFHNAEIIEIHPRYCAIKNFYLLKCICSRKQLARLIRPGLSPPIINALLTSSEFDEHERRRDFFTADLVSIGVIFMKVFGGNKGTSYFGKSEIDPNIYRRVVLGAYRGMGPNYDSNSETTR